MHAQHLIQSDQIYEVSMTADASSLILLHYKTVTKLMTVTQDTLLGHVLQTRSAPVTYLPMSSV
jgi:hypothetical protein